MEMVRRSYTDRFGRTVYPSIIFKMDAIAEKLSALGFLEAREKRFLFYRKMSHNCTAFADLRGTELVPIWEDMSALIYVKIKEGFTYDEYQHMWQKYEGTGMTPAQVEHYFQTGIVWWLEMNGVPCRTSIEQAMYLGSDIHQQYIDSPAYKLLEEYKEELKERTAKDSKKHKEMTKSFQLYLDSIKEFIKPDYWKHCRICGESRELQKHHVSYSPEVVVPLCLKCHNKVHNTEKFSHLKPEMTRKEWEKSRKSKK